MYSSDPSGRQTNQAAIPSQFISDLLGNITGEATAIEFYSRLEKIAPTQQDKKAIAQIIRDETDHFHLFSQLYYTITGQSPVYQITPVHFQSFSEGLQIAYHDELGDYEKYRNQYLMVHDPQIRDILLRAFTDEIKHAIRFGFMHTALKKA